MQGPISKRCSYLLVLVFVELVIVYFLSGGGLNITFKDYKGEIFLTMILYKSTILENLSGQ